VTCDAGKSIAVVGASGGGKSTVGRSHVVVQDVLLLLPLLMLLLLLLLLLLLMPITLCGVVLMLTSRDNVLCFQVAALLLRMYDVEGGGCVRVDGADVKTIDARCHTWPRVVSHMRSCDVMCDV
jgi:hypothetical protein